MRHYIIAILLLTNILSLHALDNTFGNAHWIGAPADRMHLNAAYLPVFTIESDFTMGHNDTLSIMYGCNDPRLMDANLNIYNIAAPVDSSYIRVSVTGDGRITLYRTGYHPDDNPSKPVATFTSPVTNNSSNHLRINSNLGHTEIWVNGVKAGYTGLNPIGNGGDYLAFPVVGDLRVSVSDGCEATGLAVRNLREPSTVLYRHDGVIDCDTTIKLPVRSLPMLRTSITLPDGRIPANAVMTSTSRGLHDITVNGHRVTDGYFYPGSTQYNRTHLYHTFDITQLLTSGRNDITVQLGEGWWCGGATFVGENWNFFGDRPSFIGRIDVTCDDGSVHTFVTDPATWECSTDGPLVEGSFFQGEIFDTSRQDTMTWTGAVEIGTEGTVSNAVGDWSDINLRPDFGDKVLPYDTITAVSVSEPRPGVYVYDMGVNMAGVPLLTLDGLRPGQQVSLRYAEMLYPDMPAYSDNAGMIMTENLRAAMCRDIYTTRGDGSTECFSPRFTLHGYRYIEITGIDTPLDIDDVKSIRLSSVHDIKAGFECSDTLINKLWDNIVRSTISNFISIPTDCPQRNERLGWMGDISVFAPTATKLADISALLEQYLVSVRDCQSDNGRFPDVAPTGFGFGGLLWGSAGITVPIEHFRQYGDPTLLHEHYPAMKRYIDYILDETIDPETNVIVQNRAWGDLGDWLSPEYDANDKSLLWECYFIHDLDIMAEVADILSLADEAERYRNMRAERTRHFITTYIDSDSSVTRFSSFDPDREGKPVDTQVSYALPIAMGIYDSPEFRDNFINTITRTNMSDNGRRCPPYSLMTGFIGTAWICEALSTIDRDDVAYRLLANRTYPSWLYPVTQGATTVWERLDSYTHTDGFGSNNSMNSFNHYSFGAVGNWLITRVLGIRKNGDGRYIISPRVDTGGSLSDASGWLDTPQGRIAVSWSTSGDSVKYTIEIPHGTEATFISDGIEDNELAPGINRL